MKKPLYLIILITIAVNSIAQNKPYRAYPGTPVVVSGANGAGAVFNNKLYFQGYDSSTSVYKCYEFTGSGNPVTATANISNNRIVFNGTIYYGYDDGTHGVEIYKWDGTNPPAITQDLNPATTGGATGVDMEIPVSLNNIIYFGGFDQTYGRELWKYNPATNIGTRLTDIYSGNPGSLVCSDQSLIVFNNKLYFQSIPSFNLGNSCELHSYDPSNGNTTMVADICPGSAGSNPQNIIVMGSKLYFNADDNSHGREIYYYDGTNPVQMVDICPNTGTDKNGTSKTNPGVIAFNNKFYFWGKNNPNSTHFDLFAFDPSNNTAALVYTVRAPGNIGIIYHNKLYFTERTSTGGGAKNFLLSYDGVSPPTYIDTTISIWYDPYYPLAITEYNNDLYMVANSNPIPSTSNNNLYRFNDTATSIQAINKIVDVSIYPNPSAKSATIGFSLKEQQNLSLNITDMNGRVIYSENKKQYHTGNNKIVVDLHSFATGNYVCRLTDEHNGLVWSGKLVKE